MDWIEFTVFTSLEGTELLYGIFAEFGFDELQIDTGKEGAEKFLLENSATWDFADINELCKNDEPSIRIYLSDTPDSDSIISDIMQAINRFAAENPDIPLGSLKFSKRAVHDDWSENWKKYYKPFTVGDKLMICPIWEEAPPVDGRKLLNINPGLSFGTGLHETTRMCLEAIEAHVTPDVSLIDLGCGSGILTIAGRLFGACDTLSIDIDPSAVHSTDENGKLNGMELPALTGDVIGDNAFFESIKIDGGYDIVVANIVAGVLIPLSERIPALIKPGGIFISSGIIKDRLDEVIQAYESHGFTILNVNRQGEWVAVEALMD